jgi:hypothetical protein
MPERISRLHVLRMGFPEKSVSSCPPLTEGHKDYRFYKAQEEIL